MRTARMLGGASLVVLACAAGCASAPTAADPPAPAPTTTVASTTPPPSSPAPSPSPQVTTPPPAAPPATTTQPVPADGSCGTVPAASGLTLRVMDTSAQGVPCADAMRLVGEFQKQITGKQPSGSTEPVSATVEGWLCVSGPPASQGGTTCSLGDKTVFASVSAE